ncbi:LysR family transcriptional regulator [Achromobacter sp. GG226]|uniref:LysR family transcriptional regulator n=1 Tax=Verticiella alkaliphila TaxID=2779529 RepID=UPI001C0D6794|nr:LysR family transcriptional regulator [Verticiella sp. GG226]MBU4610451.1 LysR family transcriptional regulator [Verticiella sp. GG226]
MPTFKQLEAFVWAVRLRGFAQAAQHLHITQSTLSKRIAELESTLGDTLFIRAGTRAVPTAAAQDIQASAEQLLSLRERLRQRVDVRPPSGRVAFGVTELVASTWLPGWVAHMRQAYPGVELEPYVDVSCALIERLRAGQIALAVLPLSPVDDTLASEEIAQVSFALMASPALSPPPRLDNDALARWPILAQSGGSGLTERFDAWALTHGLTLQRSLASNSLVAISELVLAGLGAAFLPVEPYREHLAQGRLRRIEGPVPWPRLPYFVVACRQTPSRAVQALHDTVTRNCRPSNAAE